jgi:hypothetical protein
VSIFDYWSWFCFTLVLGHLRLQTLYILYSCIHYMLLFLLPENFHYCFFWRTLLLKKSPPLSQLCLGQTMLHFFLLAVWQHSTLTLFVASKQDHHGPFNVLCLHACPAKVNIIYSFFFLVEMILFGDPTVCVLACLMKLKLFSFCEVSCFCFCSWKYYKQFVTALRVMPDISYRVWDTGCRNIPLLIVT